MEIQISIDKQELKVVDDEKIVKTYVISSSSYGEGSAEGSFKTPLGEHFIKRRLEMVLSLAAGLRVEYSTAKFIQYMKRMKYMSTMMLFKLEFYGFQV